MRLTPKKIVKAATPYGALVLYRRGRIKLNLRKAIKAEQAKLNEQVQSILMNVQPLRRNRNPKTVVSVTSYGTRLQRIAPLAVASLFRQSSRPDKIVLWLAFGEKPPRPLKKMKKLGLEIKYCEDTKSYKKLIPSLYKYPESTIITADDDVMYPKNWLKVTLAAHKKYPGVILAHTGRKITVSKDGRLSSYWDWPILKQNIKNSHMIMPNGIGGVLYPPHSLFEKVHDVELLTKLAPYGDDLWFWAMAELKGTKRSLIREGFSDARNYALDDKGLHNTINNNEHSGNNAQFASILEHFPDLRKKIGVRIVEKGMTGLRLKPDMVKTFEEQILYLKHQFAYNFAKSQVTLIGDVNILDYGCGDGYGADFLAEVFPMATVHATDIDTEALQEARTKYQRKNLHFVDVDHLSTYDLILSYQVIEHVENVDRYLRKLKQLLRKDGKIIVSTPDRRYRLTDNQKPWNPHHLREYTKESLAEDIKEVFPEGKVLYLSGDRNMLRIEYRRVAGSRSDKTIYGGKQPVKPTRKYELMDFYLTEKDTKYGVDLFAIMQNDFPGSEEYWESRYAQGGNSGAGSYDNLARFKAEVLNKFVKENKIETVIELGSGDGNQLLAAKYPHYIGFDVSKTAIELCKKIFKNDPNKEFYPLGELKGQKADLVLSLDVLFHLVEKEVFEEHLHKLFKAATKFVIIYAFDGDNFHTASHVKSRNFTDYIKRHIRGWELIEHIPNKYPHDDSDPNHTSRANFYIYKKTRVKKESKQV